MELHLTATECHLPYEITRCYMPPDTSEHTRIGRYSIYQPQRDGRLSWPAVQSSFWSRSFYKPDIDERSYTFNSPVNYPATPSGLYWLNVQLQLPKVYLGSTIIMWKLVAFFFKSSSIYSRSIRAKHSAFLIKSRSAPTHLRKTWLSHAHLCCRALAWFTCKRGRGLRRSVQTRTRWPRPLRPERSMHSFSPDWIDLVWQI